MFDSTTDSTVTEQEAVFVLYFDPSPGEVKISGDFEPNGQSKDRVSFS